MADMAEITQVRLLEQLIRAGLTNDQGEGITPITYMNSTAAIKAFCGERPVWCARRRTRRELSSGICKES